MKLLAPELQAAGLVKNNGSNLCGRVDVYDIGGGYVDPYIPAGKYSSLTGKFSGDSHLEVFWSGYGDTPFEERMASAALKAQTKYPTKTLHKIDASKYILR